MFKITTETNEPCPISAIEPPYVCMHLDCEHKLSLMAIYGIIYNRKSSDTGSIVCPFCRSSLIPKLVPALSKDLKPSFSVKSYTYEDLAENTVNLDGYQLENLESRNVIGTYTKQEEYIDNIRNTPDDDDSDDDADDDDVDGDYDDDDYIDIINQKGNITPCDVIVGYYNSSYYSY